MSRAEAQQLYQSALAKGCDALLTPDALYIAVPIAELHNGELQIVGLAMVEYLIDTALEVN